jgi:transposase
MFTLSKKELETLRSLTKKGSHNARVIVRAQILLHTHDHMSKSTVADLLSVNESTVQRVRDLYRAGGVNRALYDAPRPGQPKKLTAAADAYLVALACSAAPDGRDHWTLELLQEQLVKDKQTKSISTVAIWHRMNDHHLKPWREKNVVHTEGDTRIPRTNV